ncbi:MAG: hypothetical protein ACRDHU_08760, partial [Actinomycetota bacterium]
MADKQGLLGARSTEPDSDGSVGRDDREAYEEDWYRSLRALAERQQSLADRDAELEEDDPEPEEPGPGDTLLEPVDTPPLDEDLPEAPVREALAELADRSAPGDDVETDAGPPGDTEPRLRVVPEPVEEDPEDLVPRDEVSDAFEAIPAYVPPETEAAEPELEAAEPELEAAEPELEAAEPELEAAEPELEAAEP